MGTLARLHRYVDDFGAGALVVAACRRGSQSLRRARTRMTAEARTFSYSGRDFAMLDHPYNRTLFSERGVEVPVATAFVDSFGGNAIGLEVGNVLSHYGPVHHRVVDKYERSAGVENIDVFEISTDVPFDFIVTVSTLEHVGWDEPARDLTAAAAAIAYLRSMLRRDGGRMLVTAPLGYNPALDTFALGGVSGADHAEIFVRDRHDNWSRIERPEIHQLRYSHERGSAGALWIAEFGPSAARQEYYPRTTTAG